MATGFVREVASVAPGISQFFPGGFHTRNDHQYTASASRKHVTQVAKGATISHLIGSNLKLNFTLQSTSQQNEQYPCTVHTYNQDLGSVFGAGCISYAPSVYSNCNGGCYCLLLSDSLHGTHLNFLRFRPVPQIMTIVLCAFTLLQ